MLPDHPAKSQGSTAAVRRDFCEGCGASGCGDAPLLDLPFPTEVLENLGLSQIDTPSSRLLCPACVERGLQGRKLDLVDLVMRAPEPVQQRIHAGLIRIFEI